MGNLLLDSYPLVILPELACAIGLNEAIVLQQVHYWIEHNKREKKNLRDGHYWTYNSYREWGGQFPWWSDSTVKRIFSTLEAKGFLVSGNYNRSKMDRTKWYRVNYDALSTLPLGQIEPMENVNLNQPIPETIITDKKSKIQKAQSMGLSNLYPFPNEGVAKDNVFKSITDSYGKERASNMLSVVDWYIDTAYPHHTGWAHPPESKANRMVFAKKLLDCSEETCLDDDVVSSALERAIGNFKNCDPTIYYVTTPQVLGYWIIQDEEIGYESVRRTKYAPVDEMY